MNAKSFFIRLSIFVLLLVSIDIIIGYILDRLSLSPKDKVAYAYKYSDEEILVLGSSRAQFHYIPSIINDSLNTRSCNLGFGHRYTDHTYAIFNMITNRYTPKVIIFDIFQDHINNYQVRTGHNNDLTPFYYKNDIVKQILDKDNKFNRFMTLSSMYRYNSRISYIVRDIFRNKDSHSEYSPRHSKVSDSTKLSLRKSATFIVDTNKLAMIDDIIKVCNEKNIELFFVTSPGYYTIDTNDAIYYLEDYLETIDATFLNYLNYDKLMLPKFFADKGHLNHEGAKIFTSAVISDIKKRLKEKEIKDSDI